MSPARLPDDDDMLRVPRYKDGKRARNRRREAPSESARERSAEDRPASGTDPRERPSNARNEEDR